MTVVLFAGGGTGGHLMPALAIAEAMRAQRPDLEPFFVGARRGIEAHVLPARPWRYELLPFEPIYRRHWWRNARLPWAVWRSLRGLREVLQRERPVLAVGTGGYASGPALWAASGRGIPTVLQEQNAYPGFATRRLAPRATQIHLGFPEARSFLRPGAHTDVFDTGNPIVPPPAVVPPRAAARQSLGFKAERPLVLVVGGSQGALAVNRAVGAALDAGQWPADVQLLWQTGRGSHAEFARFDAPGRVTTTPFIDPMAPAYAAADLVVGRAGAITFAELAAWGMPAVLVPLPTAAANHQLRNAQTLSDAGAAVLLEQSKLTGESLVGVVRDLLADPARLAGIGEAARRRARPNAAAEIAGHALRLLSIA